MIKFLMDGRIVAVLFIILMSVASHINYISVTSKLKSEIQDWKMIAEEREKTLMEYRKLFALREKIDNLQGKLDVMER